MKLLGKLVELKTTSYDEKGEEVANPTSLGYINKVNEELRIVEIKWIKNPSLWEAFTFSEINMFGLELIDAPDWRAKKIKKLTLFT